jgi:hypothetical protein
LNDAGRSSELVRLQQWMQCALLHDAPDASSPAADVVLTGSSLLAPAERLAIYQHAYFARLVDCLGESFPVLRKTLGEELFTRFAAGYLEAHPSQSYTLAELGRAFPSYLEETRPTSDNASPLWPEFLIDLARFESLLGEVFDAPGAEQWPPLDASSLARLGGAELLRARMVLNPSLRIARFRFPVAQFWSEAQSQEEPRAIPAAQPCDVAVYRRRYVVRHRPLESDESQLLAALKAGNMLLDALASLASPPTAAQLETWFSQWTRQGIVAGLQLASAPA